MTTEVTEFWNKHKHDIGESLDDFYGDFLHWQKIHKKPFKQYAEELIHKWERIAKQEGFKFTPQGEQT